MLKADRLKSLLGERAISQSELARRVGISQSAIHKLVSGQAYGSAHLHKIARVLETTPGYLTGETEDPLEGALPQPTPELIADQMDMVGVAHIDQSFGLGATFTDNPVETRVEYFPRLWLESITHSPPALLTWTRGQGDSMEPTIRHGDVILLDRSQRRVEQQDMLWAFTVGELGAIKRLRIKGDRVIIQSDNPSVPPDEEPIDLINIVARVVFVGRRL